MKDVLVTVARPLPRGGITHREGKRIRLPANVVDSLERENPPFVVRVQEAPEGAEEAIAEDLERWPAPFRNDRETVAATTAAIDYADRHHLDLRQYSGLGTGPMGRATLGDVKGWLKHKD